MQIRLTESEIIEILRQHLKGKNIEVDDMDITTENNQVVVVAHDVQFAKASGRAHTNPSRPFNDGRIHVDGNIKGGHIFPNGVNDWNKSIPTNDELSTVLGQVFTSFNGVVDAMTKEKKDIDLEKIKDMFKPRDSK